MAPPEDNVTPDLSSCVVDPSTEDWTQVNDAGLHYAATDGIQQAKDEMTRRDSHRQRLLQAMKAYRARPRHEGK